MSTLILGMIGDDFLNNRSIDMLSIVSESDWLMYKLN